MLEISILISQLRFFTSVNSGLALGRIPRDNGRRGARSPTSVAPPALHRLQGVSDVSRKTLDMWNRLPQYAPVSLIRHLADAQMQPACSGRTAPFSLPLLTPVRGRRGRHE